MAGGLWVHLKHCQASLKGHQDICRTFWMAEKPPNMDIVVLLCYSYGQGAASLHWAAPIPLGI